jgi:hypothetical protein
VVVIPLNARELATEEVEVGGKHDQEFSPESQSEKFHRIEGIYLSDL